MEKRGSESNRCEDHEPTVERTLRLQGKLYSFGQAKLALISVLQRTQPIREDKFEFGKKEISGNSL
jgi:hypothetical protein